MQLSTIRAAAAALAAFAFAAMPAHGDAARDAHAAPAGAYSLDAGHTAIVARVPHMGFSYEIFRFSPTQGQLTWDPASPAANRLNVTVDVASIQTPVEGFGAELGEARFLNTAQFPTATFVSTAFRQVDATHGQVDGTLTLKGVPKPVTFDVELIGAGQNFRGATVIGVHAVTHVNNADYGFPPFIGGQTEIVIDAEFDRQQAAH